MLYLKSANFEDLDAEYEYVKEMPIDENGFENPCFGISKEDFEKNALPQMINYSKGIDLPEGFVPETFFFLWNQENGKTEIVGQFRVRHHLIPALRDGAGHIGYQIKKEHRGKGFGTEGLRLTIIEAKKNPCKIWRNRNLLTLQQNKSCKSCLYDKKRSHNSSSR